MSNYPDSRRGSAYSFGPSPSLPSPARVQYRRNPGRGYATPPNTPDSRQYGPEPVVLQLAVPVLEKHDIVWQGWIAILLTI